MATSNKTSPCRRRSKSIKPLKNSTFMRRKNHSYKTWNMWDEVNTVYMNFCIHSKHQKHYGILSKMTALYDITLLCRVLLNKLTVTQQFKNLPAFYGTRRLIKVSITFYHWPLFSATLIQFTHSHDAVVVWDWGRSWKHEWEHFSTCPDEDSNRVPRFRLPPELIYSVKYEKGEHYKTRNFVTFYSPFS
jgi:hypothetical protein